MSADKYAQFIAEQQKKLSVSGVNAVEVTEKKELSPKQKKIAAMAGDKDEIEIEGEDFAKLRAMKKEETEIEEAKERSPDYLATIHKDDPEYDKKITDLKKGHKLRIRGRLGKDNPNAPKYRMGGPKYRSSSQDYSVKDATRVDVYSRGERKMKKEEVELISIEEQAYLEEMVGKGKLPSILQHHKDNMNHHYKMMDHHSMMADKSEAVGDTRGFDHHTEQGMGHEMEMRHHMARYDHAASLGMKAKALKQVKAAKAQMDGANKALELAKLDKREY